MKKFTFSLEPVLSWRGRQYESEQQKLQQLVAKQEQVLRLCENVARELLAAPQSQEKHFEAADLHQMAVYKRHLRGVEQDLQKQLEDCSRKIAEQRGRCLQARRDHQMLEKLKAAKHAVWKQASDREIESMAEESYLAAWVTSKGAGKQ